MLSNGATPTSRIDALLGRRGDVRSGVVSTFAASSTMREFLRVTVSAYGFLSAGSPKSRWNMRNAPGLAPRHA